MFIRKVIQKKKGENYQNYRLVESIRTEKGPRQRVILNLGKDFNVPQEKWKALCDMITEKLISNRTIVTNVDEELEDIADGIVKNILHKHAHQSVRHTQHGPTEEKEPPDWAVIDLNSLYHNDVRTVGGELLCFDMMCRLGIPEKLADLGFNGTQSALALGTIMARLLAPGSERSSFHWLQQQSATGELIDFDFCSISLNRFYEIADLLFSKKRELETWLYQQEQELFSLSESIILYDLTNTFFEGTGRFNDKAKYGRSKEKRSDAPLVTLGLVLDGDGFARKSHVLPGNISEPGTLSNMLEELVPAQKTIHEQTVILDAGIATHDNLVWLAEHHFKYVVVSREKKNLPDADEFETISTSRKETIQAKLIRNEETSEFELYINSPARVQKEKAIKTKFMQRMEEDLQKVKEGLTKKNGTKAIDKVHQRIGRIKEKYKRVAELYAIEVTPDETGKKASTVSWQVLPQKETKKLTGIYCLRTNLEDTTGKKLWDLYTMLNKVEDAFRSMKSTLGLRPVYHQKERRVDAHLFITILAYHIMHSIANVLKRSNMNLNWETIRKTVNTHVRLTSVIKEQNENTIHIRTNSTPNVHQRKIYESFYLSRNLLKTEKTIFDQKGNVVTE
jgi:hypothetical protein